nr:nonribosomal peptide synthetase vlms [Quercus suber]
MVPTLFVPCRYMPSITSTKLDRGGLRRLAATLSHEQIAHYALQDSEKNAPVTELEKRLQTVWSEVLHLAAEAIGRDDSFLRIGGDSISAIQMVTAAREAGMALTVKDVFDDPRLSSVAAQVKEVLDDHELHGIEPFSLLPSGQVGAIKRQLREQCGLSEGQAVEDAFPCTGLQEGLMALAVKQPGSYMARYVYQIPAHVDMARFMHAWEQTVKLCSTLRTRIAAVHGAAIQTVIADDVEWDNTAGSTLRSFMAFASKLKMDYGTRLSRYAIVEETSNERYFVLVLHHTIFDGWSLGLIIANFQHAYDGDSISPFRSYSGFIKHTMNVDPGAACDYWKNQLTAAKRATFPPPSTQVQSENVSRVMNTTVRFPRTTNSSITKATILRAAWALVLARYCDSDDVCFGATVSGRHAPVSGIERMVGPTLATVPVRIRLDRQQTVMAMLQQVQTQATEMVAYEQHGLRNISKISQEAKEACDVSSLMTIQPLQSMNFGRTAEGGILAAPSADVYGAAETLEGYFNYPLVIQGITFDEHVELNLTYHANVLSEARLQALSYHFSQVVQQLLAQDDRPLGALSLAGDWDLQRALDWNKADAAPLQECVHDLITQQATHDPEHEAVVWSEGSLTYAELERISTQLANHLSQLGVSPGTMVPICFEKSMWAIVAMLGVMKAGGILVPIDPSHSLNRRQTLVEEVNARFMLVSPMTAHGCRGMVEYTVELSGDLMAQLTTSATLNLLSPPSPADDAYVIFTSGTTGKPKTIVIEHSALSTGVMGLATAFHIGRQSRVLQFASYVFDMSLAEIFIALALGATVCVPNEEERLQNIPEFIARTRVDTAILTPSFVNTFTPKEVPTLTTLVLGGEAPTKANLETWYGRVKLINGYGPAEAVMCCAAYEYQSVNDSPVTIGLATHGSCWVVDADDHQRLAPIGCIGELMVRSFALARGYAGDEIATTRSFVESVDWSPSLGTGDDPRFYKTGDLVKYNFNGTLEYIGRKDTQVKLRGQRVELGAIEASIQQALSNIEHVAVDVVHRETGEALVAFVCFVTDSIEEKKDAADELADELLPMDEDLRTTLIVLADEMKATLPPYMVPGLFIPLRRMPFGTSMKLDRKRLRDLAGGMAQEQLSALALANRTWVAPTTQMELRLRDVWSQVLKVPAAEIGKNDDFLQIGGDSISAIQMVTIAREAGLAVTVKDIFDDPRLSKVAGQVEEIKEDSEMHEIQPFSLLPQGKVDMIKSQILHQCGLSTLSSVEDAYPCTTLQEGYAALSVRQPGSYIVQLVHNLPRDLDIGRFKLAWARTVELCHSLRTRIVLIDDNAVQVVVKENATWEPIDDRDVRSVMRASHNATMSYGTKLSRYALVEDLSGERFFVLTSHHAIYDAASMQIVMDILSHLYQGLEPSTVLSFAGFIKYTSNINHPDASTFWKTQLLNAKPADFPPARSSAVPTSKSSNKSGVWQKTIALSLPNKSSVTKATILRAAWAIVLARNCGTDDVCFGATISGRSAPIKGLDRMTGPTIATVPVRIRLESQQTVSKYLTNVQKQASEMIPFEQFGLHNIAKLDEDANKACGFANLLVIHPAQSLTPVEKDAQSTSSNVDTFTDTLNDEATQKYLSRLVSTEAESFGADHAMRGYWNYRLVNNCIVYADLVELKIVYNRAVVTNAQLFTLCYQFEAVVQQLLAQEDLPLSSVAC